MVFKVAPRVLLGGYHCIRGGSKDGCFGNNRKDQGQHGIQPEDFHVEGPLLPSMEEEQKQLL